MSDQVTSESLRRQFERHLRWKESYYVVDYYGYEIVSAFQPIVDAFGCVMGHEALIRPSLSSQPVPAENVLEMARNSAELVFFDKLIRALHLRNFSLQPVRGEFLFMNYEFDSLVDHENIHQHQALLRSRLKELGISNIRLVIEILEHAALSESLLALMSRWRRSTENIVLALDDVQDDALTRRRVQLIDPDIIKLDRKELFNPNYQCFVDELHSKGAVLVQEGIESAQNYQQAKKAGIDWFQGYYIAAPKTISQMQCSAVAPESVI
ncbi:EAL domain-containing protein [Thaumasiovibrio sp. DFM-14]|uniref:EAL domain-containing protein n=1 Tax=Thaumasiovibrio sp. DFM-14 TaxID=3384792 RepID=UPI0039A2D574